MIANLAFAGYCMALICGLYGLGQYSIRAQNEDAVSRHDGDHDSHRS